MSSNRTDKANELLRQQLAEFFNREIEFPRDTLVTISEVKTSKDLQLAKVWLSVLPFNHSGSVLEVIRKNTGKIQQYVKKKIFIKKIPWFDFQIDDTEEKAAGIEKIIDDLKAN